MVKYVKQYGLVNFVISIGWIVLGMSVLAFYVIGGLFVFG